MYACTRVRVGEQTFHEAQADVAELRELVELLVAVPLLQRELQLLAKHVEVVDQEARRRRHFTDLHTQYEHTVRTRTVHWCAIYIYINLTNSK